jgi:hypothetical protein
VLQSMERLIRSVERPLAPCANGFYSVNRSHYHVVVPRCKIVVKMHVKEPVTRTLGFYA